ncbi:MAG TPA: hypothetical protein VJS92_04360, partial [Candidatus Polarisedimenticolaceae bacterium]|nr:hypothetical protein [Candidatus Polarisedimenticolaceae bacterium]
GVFERFWFWNVVYAGEYASTMGPAEGLANLGAALAKILAATGGLWALAAFGVVVQLLFGSRETRAFLFAWLACSAAAVCPGLYFRTHYFIALLPALALFAGAAVSHLRRKVNRSTAVAALALAAAWGLVQERQILFQLAPEAACRQLYVGNGFVEAQQIGDYLREHASPDARIAVIGSEPEIYFYARRRGATGYIYMYGLMEPQPYAEPMQREMIAEIEAAAPAYLIFVKLELSWLRRAESAQLVPTWAQAYAAEHYALEGIIDLVPGGSHAAWGPAARSYIPQTESLYYVLRRK